MGGDASSLPTILASDAERARTVDVLRAASVDGRLTLEEFSDRVDVAQAARTNRELAQLVVDLPAHSDDVPVPRPGRRTALCSRLVCSGPWMVPARSAFRCLFGTIDLDLTQARLTAHEARIKIVNLFGTVTVTVPEGVRVMVGGGGVFATQLIEPPPAPAAPDAPVLEIAASGPGGTLYVRYGRDRSRGRRARYL